MPFYPPFNMLNKIELSQFQGRPRPYGSGSFEAANGGARTRLRGSCRLVLPPGYCPVGGIFISIFYDTTRRSLYVAGMYPNRSVAVTSSLLFL